MEITTSNQGRRRVLQSIGMAGLSTLTGCSNLVGELDADPVTILTAGSLQYTFEEELAPALSVPLEIEAHGSATVARLVDSGQRDPDIVTVADGSLFEGVLTPPWYVTFTSNAIVLAYNQDTSIGRSLTSVSVDRWYLPLLDGDHSLGRTDPDQDPLGYRTLFALELAARYHEESGLTDRVLKSTRIVPETGLLGQFEIGAIDAAFTYRNMATERGYEFVALPDAIDLSSPPATRKWYSTVSYTLPSGQTIQGSPIGYASTIRRKTSRVRDVFFEQTTGSYLDRSGFVVRDQHPISTGSVPNDISEGL
ncbi:extracellular solute-binding protein [Halocatena halophila]|uniref:extracellular solute-binding protein n=1 Tax=Halocatena halophila TaxID=2814576 RepID=UPI002ED40876